MAINFPTGPTVGQIYTYGSRSWEWNGDAWQAAPGPYTVGPTGPTGSIGPTGPTGSTGITGPTGAQYGSRVVDYTSVTTTLTLNSATTDIATCATSSTGVLTIANPTGTPANGQRILLRLITTTASRTLSFDTQFKGSTDLPLPASTSNNLYDYFGFMWNGATNEWQMVSRVQGYV